LNQVTSAGATALGYDLRGNLTSSGTSAYSYTSENRMATGPSGASFAYDPTGRLYQMSGAGGVRLGYDGTDLSAEYGLSNQMLRRYSLSPID
jgi:hypothetical protein